jgi:hypothetical protein
MNDYVKFKVVIFFFFESALLAAAVGIGNCWQIENLGKSFARNR